MISNEYPHKSEKPVKPQLGVFIGSDDSNYKRKPVYPRVYHKHLNTQTRNTIYGEQADSLYGNVTGLEIAELSAAQIDFLLAEQRDY
jgi:hypothetical protein